MSLCAGPAVGPGVSADFGSNRVLLDVAQGPEEVIRVQRTGEISVLPQMPAPAVHAVDILGIEKIGPAQGFGQRIFPLRRGDQVDMVGHQAIAVDSDPKLLRLLFEQLQENDPILVHEEYVLLVVTPLGNVVGQARYDDSGDPWHNSKSTEYEAPVKNKISKRP
jgi:hypothetical protein